MPVEAGPRHYVGPEQPTAPPHPATLPPASELIADPPEDVEDAPPEDNPRPPAGDDVRGAFTDWCRENQIIAGLDYDTALLSAAFKAGAEWQRRRGLLSARSAQPIDMPLEGTVESRTILAALEMFKEQVLVHNPEEVTSGEWLNARDVDVLIQGIRAQAAKGR